MLLRVMGTFQSAAETMFGFFLFGLALLFTFVVADALSDAFRSWRIRKMGQRAARTQPTTIEEQTGVIPIRTARPAEHTRQTAGV